MFVLFVEIVDYGSLLCVGGLNGKMNFVYFFMFDNVGFKGLLEFLVIIFID